MRKSTSLAEIITFLGADILKIQGNPEGIEIHYLNNPENVDEFTLDWVNIQRSDKQQIVEDSKAKAILVSSGIEYTDTLKRQGKVILQVDNPRRAVAKVGNEIFIDKAQSGIHPSSVVHVEAEIGSNVFIGPNACIGNCKIGNNVTIHANVTLYDNVTIKNNALIHAGAIIGTDGLGCEREKDGSLVKFPHLGSVIIEDDVEIGANCQIAKGALSNTIIGKGTKINAGCYIAHNIVLGQNVWISPKANIAGSVKVEDNVTIYSGVIIREQKVIGHGATIGMGSVVTKNVPANEVWFGNPAKKWKNE